MFQFMEIDRSDEWWWIRKIRTWDQAKELVLKQQRKIIELNKIIMQMRFDNNLPNNHFMCINCGDCIQVDDLGHCKLCGCEDCRVELCLCESPKRIEGDFTYV